MSSILHNIWARLEAIAVKMLTRLGSTDERAKSTLGPTALILVLSLIASGLAAWVTYRATLTSQQTRFDLQARRIGDEVGSVMAPYKLILRAGAGLFTAQRDVDALRWRQFVSTIDLQGNYPGIQGLGFTRVIAPDRLAAHTSEMRKVWPDYQLRPQGERDVYTSIDFLEPRNWRNDRAIGFDMYSEPTRRMAMDEARAARSPRMTSAVFLAQETSENRQQGVLIYMPVYGTALDASTSLPSNAPLIGYVYGAFRIGDLFESAIRSQWPTLLADVSVRVFDLQSDDKNGPLLFDSQQTTSLRGAGVAATDDPTTPRFTTRLKRQLGGRTWQISVSSQPSFFTPWENALPWLVLGGGIAMSLLVSGIAGTMAVARKQAVDARLVLEEEIKSRKAAQAALEISNRDVLISNQELVHRVKNMMAVVSSIATQTARYTPNPTEFNAAFRDRLFGLGRVHEFLKPNPGFRPDLAELVPEILAPYAGGNRMQLQLGGTSYKVSQSIAVLLSVVINELAANAVRHGAWSNGTGIVSFDWSVATRADGTESVDFRWRERGGPKVTAPVRQGFGSNVLRFSVEQGLKGKFAAHYEPDGFVCEWSIPAAASGGAEVERVF